ncbi:unnamed protein product [Vicia faba]|uniref:C2H2-type domain-containing protein n=1 Tax=Vicia faba TaxID=3906 RepID=A0AAV1B4M7_VICFA|nr:unnamed protein product [Vicia faba]
MLSKMDEVEITNVNFLQNSTTSTSINPTPLKRKRNLPGNPDPEAEVIALSPKTLMATNRFLCETCGKGFQRDQNLQLHRRGHNLPWKLKQRTNKEIKKRVYVCPEKSCVHHDPSRALGDLTGIKKHFCRKHGEKKWKCEKCSKRYAVQSDWKAHSKTCGTREYKCDCGTIFSRRDSFITHRAFCDALAEETARVSAASEINHNSLRNNIGNYNIMGTSLVPNNMSTHFPSIFKTISSPDHHHHETTANQTRGLSLWMNQTSQPHETMITTNGNNNLHEIHVNQHLDSSSRGLVYGGIENPSSNNYQLNWVFENKLPINCSQELITSTTTSLPIGNNNVNVNVNVKDVVATHNHDATSQQISSLYSSQHQIPSHQTSSANMSATALLLKAAQIGVTSTDTSFLGSLGLKCSDNTNIDVNKFGGGAGLYGSSSLLISLGNEEDHNTTACDFPQMHPSKRRHVQSEENGGGGQTRDFLGVGVQTICHPSSINGWI